MMSHDTPCPTIRDLQARIRKLQKLRDAIGTDVIEQVRAECDALKVDPRCTIEVSAFGDAMSERLEELHSEVLQAYRDVSGLPPIIEIAEHANDYCRCQSGKKFKDCCGKNDGYQSA